MNFTSEQIEKIKNILYTYLTKKEKERVSIIVKIVCDEHDKNLNEYGILRCLTKNSVSYGEDKNFTVTELEESDIIEVCKENDELKKQIDELLRCNNLLMDRNVKLGVENTHLLTEKNVLIESNDFLIAENNKLKEKMDSDFKSYIMKDINGNNIFENDSVVALVEYRGVNCKLIGHIKYDSHSECYVIEGRCVYHDDRKIFIDESNFVANVKFCWNIKLKNK